MPGAPADLAALAALGQALVAGGLTARGLLHLFGTQTLARLPMRLATRPAPPLHRVTALLELFVAGRTVPAALLAPSLIEPLVELGFVEENDGENDEEIDEKLGERRGQPIFARIGEQVSAQLGAPRGEPQPAARAVSRRPALRARCALLPLASASRTERDALVVCDRWDAPLARDATPWPDDSSHHLAGALGGVRASRWLDLGTGSGVAPLSRRGVAPFVLGADLVPTTARAARLGAALSDHRRYAVAVSDLDEALCGTWDLVTCNAPIPDEAPAERSATSALTTLDGALAELSPIAAGVPDAPRWRHAEAGFLDRLCRRIPARLARGGLAILHARHDALQRALTSLAADDPRGAVGEVVSVVYTPPDRVAFSVTWWQPHLPARRVVAYRALTAERPHIDERDRADAAENRLPPLPAGAAS